MPSFLVDCILYRHQFEGLKCTWKGGKAPIYTAYHLLGSHKYHNHYQVICEEFLMPLYKLIFLEKCLCLSKGALESVKEYGDYFFSKECTYLRMHGGTKAPLLLPKYATDYIVHKEAVRQLFLNGFRSHLSYLKKVVFPPLPFYVGSYKFTKVKNAPEFVKELEHLHFGEKDFHWNDSQGKVVAYKATLKLNFEYIYYVDK